MRVLQMMTVKRMRLVMVVMLKVKKKVCIYTIILYRILYMYHVNE
jgi:hypothetical protein